MGSRRFLLPLSLLLSQAAAAAGIPWYDDGRLVEMVSVERARSLGLTVLDLSDGWTSSLFGPGVTYRPTLQALANESFGGGEPWRHAREDRYFELYGIVPSTSVLRARLADGVRHECHAALNRGDDARAGDPIRALQAHLACDGLLPPDGADGRMGVATLAALAQYRRRHVVVAAGPLDDETRAVLASDSRELDFRDLLRALRERVADAGGLIEDGSARNAPGVVLGRRLDGDAVLDFDRGTRLENGAPDLVSAATEAAARALGWTSPDAAIAFFSELPEESERELLVAVRLPPPPSYHGPDMRLRAEIDLGAARAGRRPSITVFCGEVALVRWPTTVGGWQWEKRPDGTLVRRFKASQTGEFVWRDVYAAPVWFAPPTTPDGEIGEDVLGPGYRSAFGLVALVHELPVDRRSGALAYEDTGERTHGTVNYRSIRGGHSHGCHRLYNHLALRLGQFVLRHRPHAVLGEIAGHYERRIVVGGHARRLHRDSRGYEYRLEEPVPVTVRRH